MLLATLTHLSVTCQYLIQSGVQLIDEEEADAWLRVLPSRNRYTALDEYKVVLRMNLFEAGKEGGREDRLGTANPDCMMPSSS